LCEAFDAARLFLSAAIMSMTGVPAAQHGSGHKLGGNGNSELELQHKRKLFDHYLD